MTTKSPVKRDRADAGYVSDVGDSAGTFEYSDADLQHLQQATFGYFRDNFHAGNGMVPDSTKQDSAASITAIGLGLTALPVAVEHRWLTRAEAASRAVTTLRFFHGSEQGEGPLATGHRGFYYHFLDLNTGRRANGCELSTIDSAVLLAGFLTAGMYFDRETGVEIEIRELARQLFERVDWPWAQNGGPTVTHGWTPEAGFIEHRWQGYSEALILYVLGLASATHPLPAESYAAWLESYEWRCLHDIEYVHAGPLFIHQLSHIWIDFRGIQDAYMRPRGIDYFENSRRASYVQQAQAIANPRGFAGYGRHAWGVTASDGPGPATRVVKGVERHFFDYRARGIPDGPDDGTLAPWAVVASLPFAPEIVLPSIGHFDKCHPEMTSQYGFKCSYNPTFPGGKGAGKGKAAGGWVSQGYYGLDQGPIVAMIENYRTGFLWRLMRRCPAIRVGLLRAGFSGGWL